MRPRTIGFAWLALGLAVASGSAWAASAPLDRYGGGVAYAPPTPEPSQKFLNWPGKIAPTGPAVVYTPPAYVLPTPQSYPRAVLLNAPPTGYQPQAYIPQGYLPPAYMIVGQAPQGQPPMAATPQVYGQQAYAPTGYVPQAIAPPISQPAAAVAAPPPLSYTAQANAPANLAQPAAPAPVMESRPAGAAALPQSIYAPAQTMAGQSAPAPQPVAESGPNSARYYSVHRDYGLTPDPIPLPPEAFGPTADLTQPELPDAPSARKGAPKGEVNAERLAQSSDGN